MIGDANTIVIPTLPGGLTFPGAVPSVPADASGAIDALNEEQWSQFLSVFSGSKRGALTLEGQKRRGLLIGSAVGLAVGGAIVLFFKR